MRPATAAASSGVAPFFMRAFTLATRPSSARMRSASPAAEARIKSRSRSLGMRAFARDSPEAALDFGHVDRFCFLLQVFVENRKNVTVPQDVDQSGLRNFPFDFDDHFRWNLDQRTGRIAQGASRMFG